MERVPRSLSISIRQNSRKIPCFFGVCGMCRMLLEISVQPMPSTPKTQSKDAFSAFRGQLVSLPAARPIHRGQFAERASRATRAAGELDSLGRTERDASCAVRFAEMPRAISHCPLCTCNLASEGSMVRFIEEAESESYAISIVSMGRFRGSHLPFRRALAAQATLPVKYSVRCWRADNNAFPHVVATHRTPRFHG